MNTLYIEPVKEVKSASVTAGFGIAEDLQDKGYSFVPGKELQEMLNLEETDIADFGDYWQRLTLDNYMADGGRYRYRRYNAIKTKPGSQELFLVASHPYRQSACVNTLNGGVDRYYDDLEPGFVNHPVLQKFLKKLVSVYDAVEQAEGEWLIQLHPYRVRADGSVCGKPAPEGLHSDGVDFVLSMMIHRENVSGGETSVATADKKIVYTRTLEQPLDVALCNDRKMLHDVTEVKRLLPNRPAWRDVLVVAFSRQKPIH
ncbi:MAG: 2OG-Fe dioxygenase family protein [Granulosicoccus sp.]